MRSGAIEAIDVAAYRIPTEAPESDGTLAWTSTTLVVVEAASEGVRGLGYTYGAAAIGALVREKLAAEVVGLDATSVRSAWRAMHRAVRNDGHSGITMMAISAVDLALWDLRARLLDLPVARLLGGSADGVPIYGSGGFTDAPLDRLADQLSGWVARGIPRVKMKTSRRPEEDPRRLDAVRRAIGDRAELFVDANGALERKQALAWAERFRGEWGVSWFEEPVSSRDVDGLRLVRDRAPSGLDVAAGEYGFAIDEFRVLLEAGAVDCLQADVTRCGGITGLADVLALAAAHEIPVSAHCAPSVSAHTFAAAPRLRHVEYFHDHARIEHDLFDGAPEPDRHGNLCFDPGRPGFGLELRRGRAATYRVAP